MNIEINKNLGEMEVENGVFGGQILELTDLASLSRKRGE